MDLENKNIFYGLIILVIVLTALLLGRVLYRNKDSFRFEVTPAKKCRMGPYMTQSGETHELCEKMRSTEEGRAEIARYSCACGGHKGSPLHMEFTPMSNANWENEMCTKPIVQKNHPSVL